MPWPIPHISMWEVRHPCRISFKYRYGKSNDSGTCISWGGIKITRGFTQKNQKKKKKNRNSRMMDEECGICEADLRKRKTALFAISEGVYVYKIWDKNRRLVLKSKRTKPVEDHASLHLYQPPISLDAMPEEHSCPSAPFRFLISKIEHSWNQLRSIDTLIFQCGRWFEFSVSGSLVLRSGHPAFIIIGIHRERAAFQKNFWPFSRIKAESINRYTMVPFSDHSRL